MTDLLVIWIMPIMFVISGAAIYYGFKKEQVGKFLKDKVLRLLVPLVVGMFTHSILQMYFDATTNGRFAGSFWEFIPHYFDGVFPFGGNFSVTSVHLWYLEVLFIFCLLFLPVLHLVEGLLVRRSGKRSVISWLGRGPCTCWPLPTIILVTDLDPSNIGMKDTGGWNVFAYMTFFLPAFIFVPNEAVQGRLLKQRWVSLALAFVFSLAYWSMEDVDYGTVGYLIESTLITLASWSWIFALLGIARRYLTFTNPFLKYANEAVLPFYILHQPVLALRGFLCGAMVDACSGQIFRDPGDFIHRDHGDL